MHTNVKFTNFHSNIRWYDKVTEQILTMNTSPRNPLKKPLHKQHEAMLCWQRLVIYWLPVTANFLPMHSYTLVCHAFHILISNSDLPVDTNVTYLLLMFYRIKMINFYNFCKLWCNFLLALISNWHPTTFNAQIGNLIYLIYGKIDLTS